MTKMTSDDLIAVFAALPEAERGAFLAALDGQQRAAETIPPDHWPAVAAAAAEKLPDAADAALTPRQTHHLRRLLRGRGWATLPAGEALAVHLECWREAKALRDC